MSVIVDLYQDRDVFYLDIKDINKLEENDIEKLVLYSNEKGRLKTIDVGQYCYAIRKSNGWTNPKKVVLNSLSAFRKKIINIYIYKKMEGYISFQSYSKAVSILSRIINFIDVEKLEGDYNKYDLIKIYRNFNKFILKNEDFFDNQTLQLDFAHIISELCGDLTRENVLALDRKIYKSEKLDKEVRYNNFNEEDYLNNFKMNSTIFDEIYYFIVQKERFPLIFKFKNMDDCVFNGGSILNKKLIKYFFVDDREYKLNNYDYVKKLIRESDLGTRNKSNYRKYYKNLIEKRNDISWNKYRNTLVNIANKSFLYLLSAVTGANLSSLINLRLSSFELVQTTKGMRAILIKPRAGYKKVSLEFSTNFLPIYKKFLNLRNYVFDNYYKDIEFDYLFFQIENFLIVDFREENVFSYKKWLENNIFFGVDPPKFYWITVKENRGRVSKFYIDNSNDYNLAAIKLSNTTPVVISKYSNTSFNEYALDLSNFLEKVEHSAVTRGRINTKKIPIIVTDKPNNITPVGGCEELKPKLKYGFNENSIQPECIKSESCLFCENYTININYDDILKIFSVRYIYNYFGRNHQNNIYIQLIHRIDEIINNIESEYPESAELIEKIKFECDQGYLNSYWEMRFNALLDFGV